jgi:hypothetical protein
LRALQYLEDSVRHLRDASTVVNQAVAWSVQVCSVEKRGEMPRCATAGGSW